MAFDLRPNMNLGVVPYQVTGQRTEGDPNWNDNCTPTSAFICLASLGVAVPDPQTEINYEYGATYHGGTSFQAAMDYIQKNITQAIQMSIDSPGDVSAFCDATGQQGFPMFAAFNCDVNANITPYSAGYYHASLPVAFDGATWTILNVWDGHEQTFSDSDFRAAYAGGVMVFHQALPIQAQEEDMFTDGDRQLIQQMFNATANPGDPTYIPTLIKHGDGGTDQIYNLDLTGDRGDGKGSILSQLKAEVDALSAKLDQVISALGAVKTEEDQIKKEIEDDDAGVNELLGHKTTGNLS